MAKDSAALFFNNVFALLRPLNRILPKVADIDEKRKHLLTIAGGAIGIPSLAYFFFSGLHVGDTRDSLFDGGAALFLLISIFILHNLKNGIWIYRSVVFMISLLFLYNTWYGPNDDASMVWLFIYPMIVFFVLGFPEGVFWFGGMFTAITAIVFFHDFFGAYNYPVRIRILYSFALVIIAIFSFSYEMLRWYFQNKLTMQGRELLEAIENIKTLSGLLPICSICKRIRDDKGYWSQVETYLSKHTDVLLTHGICDDCLKKNYPDVHIKRLQTTAEMCSGNHPED